MRIVFLALIFVILPSTDIYMQPSIAPASGYQWVKTGTDTYDSGETSTSPGVPSDTSFGEPDSDPADCSSYCSGNCDGDAYIQDREFGTTPGFSTSSCEQRAISLDQWTNPNPESAVTAGATSGTVYLPTAAELNIIQSPMPGDPGTGAGGDENKFWMIGGNSGGQSNFTVDVNYSLDWHISEFSLDGGSGNQNYNFSVTYNDAGSGNEYETSGWNNYTTNGFGQSFGSTLPISVNDISETGGSFEVIFEANSSIEINRNWGNSDATCQHGPGMEGRANFEVTYDIWTIEEILPVTLKEFKAYEKQDHVILLWSTLSEVNNQKFVIEKSFNGISWTDIGSIKGNGSSNSRIDYSFIDEDPSNINYYRLRQIDFNGSFDYSSIIKLRLENKYEFNIYPNPSRQYFNISSNSKKLSAVEIISLNGKIMERSENRSQIDVSDLENGVYYLRLLDENNQLLTLEKMIKI